jgi:hypothetical protein
VATLALDDAEARRWLGIDTFVVLARGRGAVVSESTDESAR